MLIDSPVVLVRRQHAQALLDLAMPELRRREQAGRDLAPEVRQLLSELSRAARADADAVPTGSERGSGRFRPPIVDGVTTRQAAAALGITQRALIKRIHSGRVRAEQRNDGTWLVDLKETP